MNWDLVYANPLFGVSVTVAAYAVAMGVYQRVRWLHPLIITCGSIMGLLVVARIPYESYRAGGDLISFFLGPATIALGVPLYKHGRQIREHAVAVFGGVTAGAIVGIGSAALFVWAMRGSGAVMRSMIPKSVTTPISIEIARQLGGVPELTATFTVLAGLIGSIIGPRLLRLAGVRRDLAIGLAIGTSSHGIGTARVIRDSELQGGVSGLAMALAGMITSVLAIPLQWWLK